MTKEEGVAESMCPMREVEVDHVLQTWERLQRAQDLVHALPHRPQSLLLGFAEHRLPGLTITRSCADVSIPLAHVELLRTGVQHSPASWSAHIRHDDMLAKRNEARTPSQPSTHPHSHA